jgi:hypothetical protein
MKYKFERLSEDNYKLTYKDKEFTFKSSVKIISELQSLIVKTHLLKNHTDYPIKKTLRYLSVMHVYEEKV